ncbi:hypothetical protein THAOC_00162, partial [Thalassiosira oceanica]
PDAPETHWNAVDRAGGRRGAGGRQLEPRQAVHEVERARAETARPRREAVQGPVGEPPEPGALPRALHQGRRHEALEGPERNRQALGRDIEPELRGEQIREPPQEQVVLGLLQEVRASPVRRRRVRQHERFLISTFSSPSVGRNGRATAAARCGAVSSSNAGM